MRSSARCRISSIVFPQGGARGSESQAVRVEPRDLLRGGQCLPLASPAAMVGGRVILYVEDHPANIAFMRDLVSALIRAHARGPAR
jgi:hypothetical protein